MGGDPEFFRERAPEERVPVVPARGGGGSRRAVVPRRGGGRHFRHDEAAHGGRRGAPISSRPLTQSARLARCWRRIDDVGPSQARRADGRMSAAKHA